MRRKVLAGLAAVLAGVAAVACSDAPSAPVSSRDFAVNLAKGGNGHGNKPDNAPPGNSGAASTTDNVVAYLSTLPDTLSRAAGPVVGMKRLLPLASGATASATIGSAGGLVALPTAGAYLWVPPGAVSAPTTFSLTAKPGKSVAYDFQPAGAVFAVPVVLIQDRISLAANAPVGFSVPALGYFANDADVDPATALATASQLRAQLPFSTMQFLAFPIWHFSGYIVCWGRDQQ